MKIKSIGTILIMLTAVFFIAFLFTIPPIIQNLEYHNFTDSETVFRIPNFRNVISNLPFLLVGLFGFVKLKYFKTHKIQYAIFLIGIIGVALGSSYYHFNPNNNTLIWDRLPMTITFMALFSILISEFVNSKLGKKLLLIFLCLGLFSIYYWIFKDDLRPYVLIQFYPIIVMPIILVCFKNNTNFSKGYWFLLLAYLFAKLFEYYDEALYDFIYFSGHSIKHIISAIGLFYFLKVNSLNYDNQ